MPASDLSVPELSVQLYTVREALAEDFDATLATIAGFGFETVEPFGFDTFADQLREGLPKHGLAAPTAHVGLLRGDADAILDLAAELGIGTVIDPFVDPEQWATTDGIAATAEKLNAAAEKAAARGLRVGYHNHWFEVETDFDGLTGLDVLAANLAPEVVLEVDTYWAYVGGADVPALLNRLGDRVVALHIKDGDGTRDNKKQVAVGSGIVPVWDYIAAAPTALAVVELDDSEGDRVQAIEASRAYLLKGDAR
ncbi:sugar phosphate isomerase/epimerase family protein [Microlunatus ginsengisoli]|uniref:Sugar phosphate isomerase/epimerase n=1 Tax=Microlunatus ginsengisoli TaxID=363863 RepID=A0ABP6ZGX2_9ACTN